MEYPKIKREIDKDYLAFIRKQPCLVSLCPHKSFAHHDPSVGAGGSDYTTLPLCHNHHIGFGVHDMGRESFQKRHGLDFEKEKIRLLIKYIKELKRTYPDKWFKKGQVSVKRKNKSGCCCIIDDQDNVVSVCGAHANWLDDHIKELKKK